MREEKLMSLTKGLLLALLLMRDFPLGWGKNMQKLWSETDDAGWRRIPTRWAVKDTGVGYIQTVTFLTLPLLGTVSSSHQHRHSLRSHLPILFLHQEMKLGFLTDLTFPIKRQCTSGHSGLLFSSLWKKRQYVNTAVSWVAKGEGNF